MLRSKHQWEETGLLTITVGTNTLTVYINGAEIGQFNEVSTVFAVWKPGDSVTVAVTPTSAAAASVPVDIGNLSTGLCASPTVTVSATPNGMIVPVQIGNLRTGNPSISLSLSVASPTAESVEIGNLSTGNPTISFEIVGRNVFVAPDAPTLNMATLQDMGDVALDYTLAVNQGSSPVTTVQYRVDGGAWQPGTLTLQGSRPRTIHIAR